MWLTGWLKEIFAGGITLITVFGVATGLFLIGAVLAFVLNGKGIFGAIAMATGGGTWITLVAVGAEWTKIFACCALLAILGGGLYLLLFCVLSIRESVRERRRRRAEIGRRLQYTLPDRDNSYVRARLNTALQTESEENTNERVDLEHARGLLAKIKEAPLSRAERLEAEEMSRLVAVYRDKESWSTSDLRAVNDAFSRILKLSAKYAV